MSYLQGRGFVHIVDYEDMALQAVIVLVSESSTGKDRQGDNLLVEGTHMEVPALVESEELVTQ